MLQPLPRSTVLTLVLALVLSGTITGCTHSLTTEQTEPPAFPVAAVVVGMIGSDGPDHQREMRRFRRALIAELEDAQMFARVLTSPPDPMPPDTILVTGKFRSLSDGSEGLRFLVGYGFGAPRLRARFAIDDASGRRRAVFTQSSFSYDGTGSGAHWNPIYLDDLTDDLARRTADAIIRWTRGNEPGADLWEYLLP